MRPDEAEFDCEARDFARGQFSSAGTSPPREHFAGTMQIVGAQRNINIVVVMAELAEPERQVQHRDVPGQREQAAQVARDKIYSERHQRDRKHRQHP